MDERKSLKAIGSFTVAYLLLAVAAAFVRGNREFLFYIVVMVILIGAVWTVHRHVNLTHGALWALSIWGLLHMLGGLMPVPEGWAISGENRVLYSLWLIPGGLKYDHVVHAYGFGTTTWVCWQGLKAAFRRVGKHVQPTFGLMVLAAAAGLGFGSLNEVIEFVAVLLVPNTNVGGYMNTGWDLVANLAGAFVAVKLIYFFDRGTPDETLQTPS
jgi:uncharacterized membrane protein YjdF